MNVALVADTSPVDADYFSGVLTICAGIVIALAVKRQFGSGREAKLNYICDILSLTLAMIASAQSLRGLVTIDDNYLTAQSVMAIAIFTAFALLFLVIPFMVHTATMWAAASVPTKPSSSGTSTAPSTAPATSQPVANPTTSPPQQDAASTNANTEAANTNEALAPSDSAGKGFWWFAVAAIVVVAVSFLWQPVYEVIRWYMAQRAMGVE